MELFHPEDIRELSNPGVVSRQLLNPESAPEGGVYGYEAAEWDNCMARMMSLDRDYTIKGLKFTGAAGPRGDGYSESLITGDMMGRMVLGELAKEGR